MKKKVDYSFEAVDGSYVETDDSVAYRIREMFSLDNRGNIKILERGTEKVSGALTTLGLSILRTLKGGE